MVHRNGGCVYKMVGEGGELASHSVQVKLKRTWKPAICQRKKPLLQSHLNIPEALLSTDLMEDGGCSLRWGKMYLFLTPIPLGFLCFFFLYVSEH